MTDDQSNGPTNLPPETLNSGSMSTPRIDDGSTGIVGSAIAISVADSSSICTTRTSADTVLQSQAMDHNVVVVPDGGDDSEIAVISAIIEKESDGGNGELTDGEAGGKGSRPNRRGKMPPRLTPEQRTRVIYLFAEAFRKEQKYLGAPDGCISRAARIVAEQWKQESGTEFSVQAMAYVYRRQSTPIPERKPLKPRGRPATVLTEERKKAVEQVIADPSIPLEMKTISRIRNLLPGDHGKVASSSISRIFKEIKKDKLLPKEQKPGRVHKLKSTNPESAAPVTTIHVNSSMLVRCPDQHV